MKEKYGQKTTIPRRTFPISTHKVDNEGTAEAAATHLLGFGAQAMLRDRIEASSKEQCPSLRNQLIGLVSDERFKESKEIREAFSKVFLAKRPGAK
jgi:hypothetical protein